MSTEGIEAVFLETHNWGKVREVLPGPGFELEFETDNHSGQLRNGDGPAVFVAEVPDDRQPRTRIVLKVPAAPLDDLDPVVTVETPFEATHYGTREMTVSDPDGRVWVLQAPGT